MVYCRVKCHLNQRPRGHISSLVSFPPCPLTIPRSCFIPKRIKIPTMLPPTFTVVEISLNLTSSRKAGQLISGRWGQEKARVLFSFLNFCRNALAYREDYMSAETCYAMFIYLLASIFLFSGIFPKILYDGSSHWSFTLV